WPVAMWPKRSGRRPAGLRDPSTNSEVVAESNKQVVGRASVAGCSHPFKLFAFSRTSSAVRPKNPAISANDVPRSSESFKKNRSALAHGLPMSAQLGDRETSFINLSPLASYRILARALGLVLAAIWSPLRKSAFFGPREHRRHQRGVDGDQPAFETHE